MRRSGMLLAATAVLVGACGAEDPVEASGCRNGVPSETRELLVEEATDCENGRLVVFDHTARKDAYRVAAELRGTEVLKSGDLWLLLEN
jgi:hypothetical protein